MPFPNFKFKISNLKLSSGFTLIEILVVIILIGLTLGIISTTYISSQKKGRDAQRKSDLQQVKRAMESAKNDCAGGSYYPVVSVVGDANDWAGRYNLTQAKLVELKYINSSIVDPINTSTGFYQYKMSTVTATTNVCPDSSGSMTISGTKIFTLFAKLETKNDPDTGATATKCYKGSEWNNNATFLLLNSGGQAHYVCND